MDISFIDVFLLILIAVSVFFDLTKKKIPNFLTFPFMAWGLLYHTIINGFTGFQFSGLGLIVGGAIFFIPFALGGMGGGDVKLMGAIGALKGIEFILYAALFTVLAGGVIAIILFILNGQFSNAIKRALAAIAEPLFTTLYFRIRLPLFSRLSVYFAKLKSINIADTKKIYLPYAVPIAIGAILVLAGFGEALFSIT